MKADQRDLLGSIVGINQRTKFLPQQELLKASIANDVS